MNDSIRIRLLAAFLALALPGAAMAADAQDKPKQEKSAKKSEKAKDAKDNASAGADRPRSERDTGVFGPKETGDDPFGGAKSGTVQGSETSRGTTPKSK
ncbi:MAG TPA: hypothetical protein VEB41_11050 [Burkholderiales bacterium]|nr:hypothetical protein [Burkholderiales bacterium]